MAKYGLNKVTLIGNLGRDPELKYLDQGVALTNLWMACTESYRDKNGQNVDRTEWVSVNLWRSQAEIAAKYTRKGSTVCIEGRLTSRSWETPQGEKRRVMEVEGRRIILLDSRPADPSTAIPVMDTASLNKPLATQTNPTDTAASQTTHPTEITNPTGNATETETELDDLPF
ncbi:MAG: single-stranded DNA-binding protein [Bacteroidota bacterium]